jgi:hypothetical protein
MLLASSGPGPVHGAAQDVCQGHRCHLTGFDGSGPPSKRDQGPRQALQQRSGKEKEARQSVTHLQTREGKVHD